MGDCHTQSAMMTRCTRASKPPESYHLRLPSSALAYGSIDVKAMADNGTTDGRGEGMEPGTGSSSEQVSEQGEGSQEAPAPDAKPREADADPPQQAPPVKKRRVKPTIDLDEHIRAAQEAMKAARKQVQQARAAAKLEKRKKQRLVRKASALNVDDLERIAVLKRCALLMTPPAPGSEASAASSRASASSTGSSNRADELQH